jgi:hypothetical protein
VASSRQEAGVSVPLVIVFALAIAMLGGWWYWSSQPREPQAQAPITAEAKAYTQHLQLSGVEMKATESFTGAAVVEIVGNIGNAGDRVLNRVELTCIFYDPYGQVVLRERVPIVRSTLKPGETRSFRLPFEGIPDSWNQALPSLVIASIDFAG